MTMPDWDQRINDHVFVTTLGEINQELDQIEQPDDAEALEHLQRIRTVVARLNSLIQDTDSELLAPDLLDGAGPHLVDALGEIRSYKENRETRWLASINGILDVAIGLVGWQVPYVAADPAGLREAAANYRRAAGQFLRGIEEEAEALRARLAELEQAIEAAKAAASDVAATATQTIETSVASAEQRVAAVASAVDAEKTRFDAITTEYQRTFTAGEATRTQKSDADLADEVSKHEEARELAEQKYESALTELKDQGAAGIASLEQQKAEALKLVNATGAIAYSGSYGGYAAQQGKMATIWAFGTVLALVALTAFGVWQVLELGGGAIDPAQLILRLVVTIPAFALVAFAARESGKHRENERRARRLELELAAIDPYLALLDEDQRKQIKAQVASRMFAQPEAVKGEDGLSSVDKELFAVIKEFIKK